MKKTAYLLRMTLPLVLLAFLCEVATAELPTLRLPKTGQTTVYYPGDDGDIQAGVDWPNPRFTDNGDGTVTDNLTGLMWSKDANLAADIELITIGGAMHWQDALDFVALMNGIGLAGYHDWRLPNVNELMSLLNAEPCSAGQWLMDQGYFENVQKWYWSSTTCPGFWRRAKTVTIGDERWCQGGVHDLGKANNYYLYVWPVRGQSAGSAPVWKTGQKTCYLAEEDAQGRCLDEERHYGYCRVDCAGTGQDGELQSGIAWPDPRFVDNGDGTVTDNLTGLMWLKDYQCFYWYFNLPGGETTWTDALDIVAELNSDPSSFDCLDYTAEHSDWRLPNRTELLSILDFGVEEWYILPADFPRDAGWQVFAYWASTSLNHCSDSTYHMDPVYGSIGLVEKTDSRSLWPVRTVPRSIEFHPFPRIRLPSLLPLVTSGKR